jgi:hypothetical protein
LIAIRAISGQCLPHAKKIKNQKWTHRCRYLRKPYPMLEACWWQSPLLHQGKFSKYQYLSILGNIAFAKSTTLMGHFAVFNLENLEMAWNAS